MVFNLSANCEFEAENIIDAFNKLSEHFSCIADNMDGVRDCESHLITGGEIKINPTQTWESDTD